MAYELSIGHGVPLLFMPGSKQANNCFSSNKFSEKKITFLYVFGEDFTSL